MHKLSSLLFLVGLGVLLFALGSELHWGATPMLAGGAILQESPAQVGSANIVTSVVLAYRGIDTLGELSILFAAASAAGLLLGRRQAGGAPGPEGGFILRAGSGLLFPLLLVVGLYIVLHGHLTPGGGFQGGVILAAAFFIPLLAQPGGEVRHAALSYIEGLAGAAFIAIGLWSLFTDGSFLQPRLGHGVLGELLSAGTLPLLYLAVGLKVGAELASLLARLGQEGEA